MKNPKVSIESSRKTATAEMDEDNLYDEFGNYIGPEIDDNVTFNRPPCLSNASILTYSLPSQLNDDEDDFYQSKAGLDDDGEDEGDQDNNN